MTYCVGVKLEEGLILASDSRTHAGVDNYAKFCKMTVFERAGDRVLVLLSSGGLAATQAVINVLRQRAVAEPPHIWSVGSMFDVANLVSDAMRAIERRDGPFLEANDLKFNASFILGGQIAGEEMRLFACMPRETSSRPGPILPSCRPAKPSGKPILTSPVIVERDAGRRHQCACTVCMTRR
jgi:putative proteasome-type protease